jgi:hypothetical protein
MTDTEIRKAESAVNRKLIAIERKLEDDIRRLTAAAREKRYKLVEEFNRKVRS